MEVRVHVASCNTRSATELCVRTLRARAGLAHQLLVGDCGSTDGSIEMLREFERCGWLAPSTSPRGAHIPSGSTRGSPAARCAMPCSATRTYSSGAAAGSRSWSVRPSENGRRSSPPNGFPEHPNAVEPVGLNTVRLASRPAPWLLLVDVEQLRGLETSFRFHVVETSSVPEGSVLYDVGGWLAQKARDAGLRTLTMPDDYARAYKHFGGLSWGGRGLDRNALRKRRDRLLIRAQLAVLRHRQGFKP
jgi:hypothetical protein